MAYSSGVPDSSGVINPISLDTISAMSASGSALQSTYVTNAEKELQNLLKIAERGFAAIIANSTEPGIREIALQTLNAIQGASNAA